VGRVGDFMPPIRHAPIVVHLIVAVTFVLVPVKQTGRLKITLRNLVSSF
jgi:hypothetical protein